MLDIIATTFMILGSPNSPFTLHGFIGYSALAGMVVDTYLFWRVYLIKSKEDTIPVYLDRYSLYAYIWWVIAFITGAILVLVK